MLRINTFCLFFIITFFHSTDAYSGGKIDFLEIDDDIVSFSTTETKTHTLPSCVESDKSNLWSVSLTTESGRAVYSLALTSMAKGEEVELSVESAQDCDAVTGIERVKKVNIVMSQTQTGSLGHFNVYQGDGVTFLGTLVYVDGTRWYYVDEPSGSKTISSVNTGNVARTTFYFAEADCAGEFWIHSVINSSTYYVNNDVNNGQFYKRVATKTVTTNSYSTGSGVCTNTEPTEEKRYELVEAVDNTCGVGPCILRAE